MDEAKQKCDDTETGRRGDTANGDADSEITRRGDTGKNSPSPRLSLSPPQSFHLPFHSGFRFSMNDRKPSFASSVFINSRKYRFSTCSRECEKFAPPAMLIARCVIASEDGESSRSLASPSFAFC